MAKSMLGTAPEAGQVTNNKKIQNDLILSHKLYFSLPLKLKTGRWFNKKNHPFFVLKEVKIKRWDGQKMTFLHCSGHMVQWHEKHLI